MIHEMNCTTMHRYPGTGMKMRVLHITNAFPSSGYKANPGYGIFIKEQVDSLREKGIDCEVVYIDARTKGVQQYLRKVPEIKKQSIGFDLIHCHHTYTAFATIFFAQPKLPVITSFMSPKGTEGRGDKFVFMKKFLYDYVQNRSICFVEKTDPSCERRHEGRGFYVPIGVNMNFFKEISRKKSCRELGIEDKTYLLFCSARNLLRPEKRYDIFQQTLNIVRQRCAGEIEELVMVGEERHRVPFFFNAASVYVLTSDYEGSPNAVKEALACNTPVVTTNIGNVKEMLEDMEGCFISESNNPAELADLTLKALEFERVKGRERLKRLRLDMESVAHTLVNIYEHAIKEYVNSSRLKVH